MILTNKLYIIDILITFTCLIASFCLLISFSLVVEEHLERLLVLILIERLPTACPDRPKRKRLMSKTILIKLLFVRQENLPASRRIIQYDLIPLHF